MPDFRKQSLYFPAEMLRELEREAHRVDRSVSWVVQRCIRRGIEGVRGMSAEPAQTAQAPQHELAQETLQETLTDERV